MMKTIHNNIVKAAAVAAIVAGMAIAQGPGFGRMGAGSQTTTQDMTALRLERMTTLLTLDVGQQQQAKAIFDKASAASLALQPALLQAQTALRDAARTGKNIDTLSAAVGTLVGKMRAIQTAASAEFYNLLTPAQRTQMDKLQGSGVCMGLCNGTGGGGGMGMRGRGMGMMGGGSGICPRQ